MSLAKYMQARLVVQRPETTAYDASRAMQDNHIGAVIVHDGSRVVGMVTDRDLSIEVVAYDLDPFDTRLDEIMSSPVALLPPHATAEDAARLMVADRIRRIPIVDGTRVVGLVTLDDLLLERAVDSALLAAIVRGQLSEPSRLKRRGPIRPTGPWGGSDAMRAARRHAARAQRSYAALLARTQQATGLAAPERAAAALEEVLSAIVRRIRPEEARELLAQVPSLLADRLAAEVQQPDREVTRHSVERAIAARLSVDAGQASQLARAVGQALGQAISAGEAADVRGQLPADMQELLAPATAS